VVAPTANISQDLYDRDNNYVETIVQQGVPWVDADENDGTNMLRALLQDFMDNVIIGSAVDIFISNAYKIEEATSNVNNLKVRAEIGYVRGLPFVQTVDTDHKTAGANLREKNQHAISTSISTLVLGDSSANWVVNELVGRELQPDITDATTFTITANTATTITIGVGDLTTVADVFDTYAIQLSTPGGVRTDGVFLNVWEDEVGKAQDPALEHAIGPGVEAQRRIKVRAVIEVQEGAEAYTDYVDSDGLQHFRIQIARLDRTATSAVTAAMITDLRSNVVTTTALELIDEVEAARGSKASLDARLDVSLNEDGTLSASINAGSLDTIKAVEQAVPDNTLKVQAGVYAKSDRSQFVNFLESSSGTFAVASGGGQERIYLVQVDDAGAIDIASFNEVAAPADPFVDGPAPAANKQAVAYVLVDELVTVVINSADITDIREFLNLPSAGGGTTQTIETIVATASQTVFSGIGANVQTADELRVYLDGVYQIEGGGEAYTVTGANEITFNAGLSAGQKVTIDTVA